VTSRQSACMRITIVTLRFSCTLDNCKKNNDNLTIHCVIAIVMRAPHRRPGYHTIPRRTITSATKFPVPEPPTSGGIVHTSSNTVVARGGCGRHHHTREISRAQESLMTLSTVPGDVPGVRQTESETWSAVALLVATWVDVLGRRSQPMPPVWEIDAKTSS
jgi:hypothetical protein